MDATHMISAVYYPGTEKIELTWENIATNETVCLFTKVDAAKGKKISSVVAPCTYFGAISTKTKGD